MFHQATFLAFAFLPYLQTTLAQTSTSDIFPNTVADNSPECISCLEGLVENTCNGADDAGFHDCLCGGPGAFKFRDECSKACCGPSLYCDYQPYTEWWTQCVDDYPQWCHNPPKRNSIGDSDLELWGEHCTKEEIAVAKELASATTSLPPCQATSVDDSLRDFNRACTPTYATDGAAETSGPGDENGGASVVVAHVLEVVPLLEMGWIL